MCKTRSKLPIVLFVLPICIFSIVAKVCADRAIEPTNTPKVLAVTQITQDGLNKTNLLSDGSLLYINELVEGRHLVAKVSLQTAGRTVLPTTLTNLQALDISSDHKKILVSSTQSASNINELWSFPTAA